MADLLKQLAAVDVTGTSATVYTVPADTVTSVVHIIAVNTAALARTLSITAGGKKIANDKSIASNEAFQFKGTVVLNATDTIDVVADDIGIELIASGVEVTDQPGAESGSSLITSFSIQSDFSTIQWTNMPAALTEYRGTTDLRQWVDLTDATEARLVCRIGQAGASGAEFRVQYSIDESAWDYLDEVDGPKVDISTTGTKKSAWVTLAAGAKADVVTRLIGINGNGTADPQTARIAIQVR